MCDIPEGYRTFAKAREGYYEIILLLCIYVCGVAWNGNRYTSIQLSQMSIQFSKK